jgi:NADH:ubiquinone oxidoreductase subunit D
MIIDAEPDIGFLHSGFEKLGEVLDFNQYVTIVDRMNYISPMANEIAWQKFGAMQVRDPYMHWDIGYIHELTGEQT